jgi:hypothetical protein
MRTRGLLRATGRLLTNQLNVNRRASGPELQSACRARRSKMQLIIAFILDEASFFRFHRFAAMTCRWQYSRRPS